MHSTTNFKREVNPLCKQVLGRVFHVVIRERRHRVVAVVVVRLVADLQTLDARLLGRLLEVLGQKLALLVEVVAGALFRLVWVNNRLNNQHIPRQ